MASHFSIVGLFRTALLMFIGLTVLTGAAYPLVVTGLSRWLFPEKAGGSPLRDERGRVIGSRLVGQQFDDPALFWGRPSATADVPYNAAASSGSNLGPSNPALMERINKRIVELKKDYPGDARNIPVDLVTASASGLDPHISPAAALWQAPRVSRERGIPEAELRRLIQRSTTPRLLGVLGEPAVNVLELNVTLEQMDARRKTAAKN